MKAIKIHVKQGNREMHLLIREDAEAGIPEILEVCTIDKRSGNDVPFVRSRISTKSSLESMSLATHEIARFIQNLNLAS